MLEERDNLAGNVRVPGEKIILQQFEPCSVSYNYVTVLLLSYCYGTAEEVAENRLESSQA